MSDDEYLGYNDLMAANGVPAILAKQLTDEAAGLSPTPMLSKGRCGMLVAAWLTCPIEQGECTGEHQIAIVSHGEASGCTAEEFNATEVMGALVQQIIRENPTRFDPTETLLVMKWPDYLLDDDRNVAYLLAQSERVWPGAVLAVRDSQSEGAMLQGLTIDDVITSTVPGAPASVAVWWNDIDFENNKIGDTQ